MDIRDTKYTFNGHVLMFGEKKRAERLKRLRELMEREELSCLLLLGKNVDGLCQWLTALPGPDIPSHKDGGYLIRRSGPLIEIGSDAVLDEAFYESYRELDEMPVPTLPIENLEFRKGLDIADMSLTGQDRAGVVHLDNMKKKQRDYLLEKAPDITLVDMTLPVLELISVKDGEEIEAMRVAANSHDRLFSMMQFAVRPERLEKEIVTELRYYSYSMGGAGQDNTRMTLVDLTSAPDGGPKAREPLLYPGRRLKVRDRVNLAVRAESYSDYYAGLGRCFVLGKACEETRRYWEIAVEAQRRAAALLKPGAVLSQVADGVNRYLQSVNIPRDESAFLYGIGYTVGEVPTQYGVGEEVPLKEGMTLVAAPRIQCEGKDDFCCMDTYLITSQGCERLTQTPQELIELSLD